MKKLIVLTALIIAAFASHAQTTNIVQGAQYYATFPQNGQTDTIVKSTTDYVIANVNSQKTAQDVYYSISIDSLGGSPACTISPYSSIDGIHWVTQGSNIVITTHNTWKFTSNTPGVSDTTVQVAIAPFPSGWIRFKFVWTSATQRGTYKVAFRTNNVR